MPAIAPLPLVRIVMGWEMPFASGRKATAGHGEAARVTAREADRALDRVEHWLRPGAGKALLLDATIDPVTSQEELRAFAAANGVDFDALLGDASRSFTSPVIHRREESLSAEELESLFEDDQRTFDR